MKVTYVDWKSEELNEDDWIPLFKRMSSGDEGKWMHTWNILPTEEMGVTSSVWKFKKKKWERGYGIFIFKECREDYHNICYSGQLKDDEEEEKEDKMAGQLSNSEVPMESKEFAISKFSSDIKHMIEVGNIADSEF
jgi:hypothetical protein